MRAGVHGRPNKARYLQPAPCLPAPCPCPFLPAKRRRYAFLAAHHGAYGPHDDQALCNLYPRRHKRTARYGLAVEQVCASEEEGGKGGVIGLALNHLGCSRLYMYMWE